MGTISEVNLFLCGARSTKTTLHPLFKAFYMRNLFKIVPHHVQVPSLNQHVLPITDMLQRRLVVLLLLYDLFFDTERLSLLPGLLLFDIVHSKLPELLLEHQLVILGPDIVLNLLLAAL